MEVSGSELRNEMRCATEFYYHLGKIFLETMLMNEAWKDKRFDESTIFEWQGDFKKGRLSAEQAPRSGQIEGFVNDRNVLTVWEILQENRQMTYVEIARFIKISKMPIFRILHNNFRLHRICSGWDPHHLTDWLFTLLMTPGNKKSLMLWMETDASKLSKFPADCINRWWNLVHRFNPRA